MRSPSERKSANATLGLVALVLAAVWIGAPASELAAAEPDIGLASPAVAGLEERATRVPARMVAFHEEEHDDHDRHGHEDDHEDWHGEEHHEEDFEELEEEIEFELARLEVERAALESFFGRLELIQKMAQIAKDDDDIAVLATIALADELDIEPESKARMLRRFESDAPSKAARRVARLKLAEHYADHGRGDDAAELIKKLVFGESR